MFPTGEGDLQQLGFWLLGLVVEKASGMTYEDYVEKKIFEPLGMTRTMYCNSAENVARRAPDTAAEWQVPRADLSTPAFARAPSARRRGT